MNVLFSGVMQAICSWMSRLSSIRSVLNLMIGRSLLLAGLMQTTSEPLISLYPFLFFSSLIFISENVELRVSLLIPLLKYYFWTKCPSIWNYSIWRPNAMISYEPIVEIYIYLNQFYICHSLYVQALIFSLLAFLPKSTVFLSGKRKAVQVWFWPILHGRFASVGCWLCATIFK